MIGYAVDCFGQAAQMPQIYQGFDIQYTIFKRGIQTEKIPSSDFIGKVMMAAKYLPIMALIT